MPGWSLKVEYLYYDLGHATWVILPELVLPDPRFRGITSWHHYCHKHLDVDHPVHWQHCPRRLELSLQVPGCASSPRQILILRQTGPFRARPALADGSAWTVSDCKFPVVSGDEIARLMEGLGSDTGHFKTMQALATLPDHCRRSAQFTEELKDALKIIQRGDMSPAQMRGDWAGEIGQTQFMPSSYLICRRFRRAWAARPHPLDR